MATTGSSLAGSVSTGNTVIDIEKVTKVYQTGDVTVHALRGVDLKIDRGEFVAVMGASGSGKSTLMNILGGLDYPTVGEYRLDGEAISRLDSDGLARIRNRTLGFVFQSFNLLSRTTALENVELPLLYGDVPARERHHRAAEALTQVGLADRMEHHPNQMSGGQQQRVAIARALVTRPKVILADEPTGNLDSETSVEVMTLFQELWRGGITIVLVTHEPDVAAFAGRVVNMKDGRVKSDRRQEARNARDALAAAIAQREREQARTGRTGGARRRRARGGRMTSLQTVRIAGRALMRNKLRSFLTALGIIIGVGAVIATVAIGDGAKSMVEQSFAAMGSNLLIIMSGTTTSGGAHGGFGSQPTLTWDDMAAIQREVTSVKYTAPQLRTTAQIINEEQNWTTSVTGTTPEYFLIRTWTAAAGSLISTADVDGATKTVVLGQTVVDKLYGPNVDPNAIVGQSVRIKNVPFQVIGVLERKGQSASGQDYDDGVFIPSSTFQAKVQGGLKQYLSGVILANATSNDTTARAERQITSLLRERHHLRKGSDDDFSIRNLSELANAQQEGDAHADHAAGEHRRGLAAGRRRRHHEHHAGQRHRAHARDRPAHGGRRAAVRHPLSVPRRVADPVGGGRHHRHRDRDRHRRGAGVEVRLAAPGAPAGHHHRGGVQRAGRRRLRPLPGAQGVAARSDRSAEVRVRSASSGRWCSRCSRRGGGTASGCRDRGAPARGAVARRRARAGAQAPAGSARGALQHGRGRAARRRAVLKFVAAADSQFVIHAPDVELRARAVDQHCDERPGGTVVHQLQLLSQQRERQPAHLGLRADQPQARRRPGQRRRDARHGEGLGADDRSEPANRVSSPPAPRARAVDVARETLDNQNKHLEQIQSFVDLGRNPTIDLLQARVDQANAEVQLINAQGNYATTRARL